MAENEEKYQATLEGKPVAMLNAMAKAIGETSLSVVLRMSIFDKYTAMVTAGQISKENQVK